MKVTEIDKMIKTIDGIDFNASKDFIKTQILEVKNMLVYERQCAVMEEKGGKTSLLTAIKTILSGAKSMGRESLSTVQHSEDGKPFICDGYVAISWNDDIPELKAFEQTPAERSIKLINSIMPKSRSQVIEAAISDDDKLILNNLAKYVKLHKAETTTPIIKIFNKYYNAAYLKKVFDIVGAADMQSIYYLKQEESYPNFIYKDNLTAVILPCRVLEGDKQKIESQTLEFIKLLKN